MLYLAAFALANAQTILDVVRNSNSHQTLARLVASVSGSLGALQSPGQLNLIAPTDAAFDKLSRENPQLFQSVQSNPNLLTQVLRYHVIPGNDVRSINGRSIRRALTGQSLRVDNNPPALTLTFGLLSSSVANSIAASNGIVHVADTVLIPPTTSASATATAAGLSDLTAALTSVNLAGTVDRLSCVTIFAPNNAAFAALRNRIGNPNALAGALLASTLQLHVVRGTFFSTDIAARGGAPLNIRSLQGSRLTISSTGNGISVSSGGNGGSTASVVNGDIIFNGGVIHVIDNVLTLPACGNRDCRKICKGRRCKC